MRHDEQQRRHQRSLPICDPPPSHRQDRSGVEQSVRLRSGASDTSGDVGPAGITQTNSLLYGVEQDRFPDVSLHCRRPHPHVWLFLLSLLIGSFLWLSPRPARADDLDAAYLPQILTPRDISAVAVQPDGKIIFSTLERRIDNRRGLVRLNVDGTHDPSFNAQTDLHPYAMALQPSGKILIGGQFTINGATKYFVRLNMDGTLDASFINGLPGPDGFVERIAIQPDGKILIGGYFSNVNGVSRVGIARLNADGTLDTGFGNGQAGVENSISSALTLQPDGKILIGGQFTEVNGVPRDHLARLNSDGTLDPSFPDGLAGASNIITVVNDIALQPDGKILVGGGDIIDDNEKRIARLNSDGTLDVSFANGLAGTNQVVQAIAVQPDGKILIGGVFAFVHGTTRNRIARLNTDGTLDTTFLNGQAGASGGFNAVNVIALQPDGKILIGGGSILPPPTAQLPRAATTRPGMVV